MATFLLVVFVVAIAGFFVYYLRKVDL